MITSTTNAQVKNVIKLNKNAKSRKEQGLFVVEGIRMFTEIPEQSYVKIYVTEAFEQKHLKVLQDKLYEVVAESVFREMSDTQSPQGVLAIVKQCEYQLETILSQDKPCFMMLENLQDPGNLGTILRTAEGAGVSAIIMSSDTVDVYNPKVVRATMGAIFRIPFVYVENLNETIIQLNQCGIQTYAAHLAGDDFYSKNYCLPTAFVIGNEGNGLSDAVTNLATHKIRIPMQGKVESLNAATAATVLMYECMRQRLC